MKVNPATATWDTINTALTIASFVDVTASEEEMVIEDPSWAMAIGILVKRPNDIPNEMIRKSIIRKSNMSICITIFIKIHKKN